MQLLNVKESSRSIKRKRKVRIRMALIFLVIISVIGAGVAYKPAKRNYHTWKQQRALNQAKEFLAKNDLPNAKLALDVAFAAVPGDLEALRVAANLLEQAGSPGILPLRRRIIQIAPDSVEDRAALVMTALRFKDINAARDAMRDMSHEQAQHPAALKAALAYAMATDNKPIADALFDRIKEIEPDDEDLKMLHALLRLKSPQGDIVAAARKELEELAENPKNSLLIQRELFVNAIARKDMAEAGEIAAKILSSEGATLADRLNQANLRLNVEQEPFAEIFASLTPFADQKVSDAVELSRWALMVQQPETVEAWIASLGDELKNSPELRSIKADAVAMEKDWDRLGDLLKEGVWGDIKKDTVLLALSTRIESTRSNATLQKQLWAEAISSAGKSLSELRILNRLANLWQEEDFSEKTLWVITRGFSGQAWASQTLFNVYRARQDTANLRTLLDTLRRQDSTVPRYKYDWALLSLISQRSSGWSPAKTAMQELYTLDPKNAAYVTGYALALAQSERVDEALVLIDAMSPQDREFAARAPYLAYIYGMGRRSEDYARVAQQEKNLPQLLPEEKWLFELGQQMLNRPLPKKKPISATEEASARVTSGDDSGVAQD